jgi:hypothetical protein
MMTTNPARTPGVLGRLAAAGLDVTPVIVPAPEGAVSPSSYGQMRRWLAAQGAWVAFHHRLTPPMSSADGAAP